MQDEVAGAALEAADRLARLEDMLALAALLLTDPAYRHRLAWVRQDGMVGRAVACRVEPRG